MVVLELFKFSQSNVLQLIYADILHLLCYSDIVLRVSVCKMILSNLLWKK